MRTWPVFVTLLGGWLVIGTALLLCVGHAEPLIGGTIGVLLVWAMWVALDDWLL